MSFTSSIGTVDLRVPPYVCREARHVFLLLEHLFPFVNNALLCIVVESLSFARQPSLLIRDGGKDYDGNGGNKELFYHGGFLTFRLVMNTHEWCDFSLRFGIIASWGFTFLPIYIFCQGMAAYRHTVALNAVAILKRLDAIADEVVQSWERLE